jgi:glyoxylase I family protein
VTIAVLGSAPLLQVFDMPTSIHFYRDLLGFEVVANSQPERVDDTYGWALLRLDGVELMLNTAYEDDDQPAAPDPARIAAHEDTAIYFSCPDVEATYQHFQERGLQVDRPTLTGYGYKQVFLKDPDGFGLCFHWPAAKEPSHD